MGRAGRLGLISIRCGGFRPARGRALLCCAAVVLRHAVLCLSPDLRQACACCIELGRWCPAELFTWASGRQISKEEAMRCAKREPGRSWEAIEPELTKLGAPSNPHLLLRQGYNTAVTISEVRQDAPAK